MLLSSARPFKYGKGHGVVPTLTTRTSPVPAPSLRRRSGQRHSSKVTPLNAAANQVFQSDQGSWVVAPSTGSVKGVVHFLGGAFAGAAPQLLYSLLLDMLASSGYTVIATPYAVTFRHQDCAAGVRNKFLNTVGELRGSQSLARLCPENAPTFGVGHSNGALLHLLMGCYFDSPTTSNVIISFNNKQVKDAIPIPGFLGALSPTVKAARSAAAGGLPLPVPLPVPLPSTSDVLQFASAMLPGPLRALDAEGQLRKAALALDQLGEVVGEVGDGVTDFTPSPSESRALIGSSYSVRPTLLVRFQDDSIDETVEMEKILRARFPQGGVETLVLPGSHITPCGGDLDLMPPPSPGSATTPAEAVLQLVKVSSQMDVRRLGRNVVGWLDSCVYRV